MVKIVKDRRFDPDGLDLYADQVTKEWIDKTYHIYQPRKGYRFSLDSLILADFVDLKADQKVLDAGTGTGVLPLLLLKKAPGLSFTGVEIQSALARLAQRTMVENGLSQVEILEADLRTLSPSYHHGYHVVVSNPPYFKKAAGIISRDETCRLARHELALSMGELLDKAYKLLRPKGVFYCVYPLGRMVDLWESLGQTGFSPRRLRFIHARPDRPARAFLFSGSKDAGQSFTVDPPLILYDEKGEPTADLEQLLGERTVP